MITRLLTIAFLLSVSTLAFAAPPEPGWSGSVVAVGDQRAKIQSTDIVRRPYRPLHFYGNTVRRQHYRGMPVPMPRDLFDGMRALLGRQ